MLTFKDVSFHYDEENFDIIDKLSFEVQDNEFISIIGISGCGKSTILRLTNGLLKKKNGDIYFNGQDISDNSRASGYMPQKDLLFPWRTIEKNVCLPMEIAHIPATEQKERCAAILKEVGLSDYSSKYPKDLSGGMRQRVSFARTLLTDAPLLLLDEPFSALDALTRMSMQEWLLNQWSYLNKTVLFITHDVEEAIFMSSRIFLVSETPIQHLEEITVPLDFPRKREQMNNPEILQLKEYLLDSLRKQVIL